MISVKPAHQMLMYWKVSKPIFVETKTDNGGRYRGINCDESQGSMSMCLRVFFNIYHSAPNPPIVVRNIIY